MSMQLNIRVSEEFMTTAKAFAQKKGFLNVQEFIRDAAREQMYEVRPEFLERLKSKDATTFLSDKEAIALDKELRCRLANEKKNIH